MGPVAATLIRRCAHCQQRVRWMPTREGHRRCFDADPVPVSLDDGTGWLLGTFTVNRRRRLVLAPADAHDVDKRERAEHVMLLHRCSGQAA